MVCTGKLPKTILPINFREIVKSSKYYCVVNNEDCSPILAFTFPRENGKKICVSIWTSGSVNIVGVLSLNEAKKYYDVVVTEISMLKKLDFGAKEFLGVKSSIGNS